MESSPSRFFTGCSEFCSDHVYLCVLFVFAGVFVQGVLVFLFVEFDIVDVIGILTLIVLPSEKVEAGICNRAFERR